MADKRVIFESEEEAINFIKECIAFKGDFENLNVNRSILLAKQSGYIRRNPVEEAEEIYKNFQPYFKPYSPEDLKEIIDKQHEAIQYLKERQK